jgi:hypothetical protein
MLKGILPYVLIILFFWFLPDIVVGSKNLSNYIFKEATVRTYGRVEIKVNKKLPYLPTKYSVLGVGESGYRVEMLDEKNHFSRSVLANDENVYIFENFPAGTYDLRVGKDPGFELDEMQAIEAAGNSIFKESEVLKTTIPEVTIQGDVFIAPVLL